MTASDFGFDDTGCSYVRVKGSGSVLPRGRDKVVPAYYSSCPLLSPKREEGSKHYEMRAGSKKIPRRHKHRSLAFFP